MTRRAPTDVTTERLTDGQLVEADITWSQVAFLAEDDPEVVARLRAQVGAGSARLRYADVVDLVEPWMRKFDCASIPGVDRAIPHWTPELARAKSARVGYHAKAAAAARGLLKQFGNIGAVDPAGFAHALRAATGSAAHVDADARAWARKWASDPGFQQRLAAARAAGWAARDADEAYRRAVRRAAADAPSLGS